MWEDPIVAEVRSARERLAGKFAFDVHSIFADLRKRQVKLGRRLVRRQSPSETEQMASPDHDPAALRTGR